MWRRFVEGMELPATRSPEPLLDADALLRRAATRCRVGMARQFHACTHTTFRRRSSTAGTKINIIPDTVELEIDIRTLPGQGDGRGRGDARTRRSATWPTTVELLALDRRSVDRVADRHAAVGHARARTTRRFYEGSAIVPFMTVGATDAGFFRRTASRRTASACSAGPHASRTSARCSTATTSAIDVESLRLSTELWEARRATWTSGR